MSAATITPSDLAPNEPVHYSFSTAEFDLGGSKKSNKSSFETDDPSVITEAQGHPWLDVTVAEDEAVQGEYIEQLKPEEDVLSWATSIANDHEEARKAEEAKADTRKIYVALDAGLDQSDPAVTDGGFAETLAAEDVSPPVVEATTDIVPDVEPEPTFPNNEDDE